MPLTDGPVADLVMTYEVDGARYKMTGKVKCPVVREWYEKAPYRDSLTHPRPVQYYLTFQPQEETGVQFTLEKKDMNNKKVSKTAEIEVDVLDVVNILEAQRRTGAPEDARMSVYKDHPNTKSAILTFRWEE